MDSKDDDFVWLLPAGAGAGHTSETLGAERDPLAPLVRTSRESADELVISIVGAWSHTTTEQLAAMLSTAWNSDTLRRFWIDTTYSDVRRNKVGRAVRIAERWNKLLAERDGWAKVIVSEPVYNSNRRDFPDLFAVPSSEQTPPNRVEIEVKCLSVRSIQAGIDEHLLFLDEQAVRERYHELVDKNLIGTLTAAEETEFMKLDGRIVGFEEDEAGDIERQEQSRHDELMAALSLLESEIERLESRSRGEERGAV